MCKQKRAGVVVMVVGALEGCRQVRFVSACLLQNKCSLSLSPSLPFFPTLPISSSSLSLSPPASLHHRRTFPRGCPPPPPPPILPSPSQTTHPSATLLSSVHSGKTSDPTTSDGYKEPRTPHHHTQPPRFSFNGNESGDHTDLAELQGGGEMQCCLISRRLCS